MYSVSSIGVLSAAFFLVAHEVSSLQVPSTKSHPSSTQAQVAAWPHRSRAIQKSWRQHSRDSLFGAGSNGGSKGFPPQHSHHLILFAADSGDVGEAGEDDLPQVPSSFSEDVGQDFDAFLDDIIARKRHVTKRTDPPQATSTPRVSSQEAAPTDQNSNEADMRRLLEQQQAQIQMLLKQNQEQMSMLQAKNQANFFSKESLSSPAVKESYEASDARKSMSAVPSQLDFNPQEDTSSFVSSKDLGIAPPDTENIAPLRAMLFIDGTNLYYSTFSRQVIGDEFGSNWVDTHKFDWNELPRVICEALQDQVLQQGWAARPVEIVRACVFTSYKRSTGRKSPRVQMFEDMSDAGYDVHIMETVGDGEKCVDIQLATEILHYATVPKAYDIAILLSGDKDFLPALIRTRQKGKRVAIVAAKRGCNQAFFDTPNIKDFDMIFWDDYLDRLIKPLTEKELEMRNESGEASDFTLAKIIRDIIRKFGDEKGQVSSRDLGRCLKQLPIGDSNFLELVKESYRSIRLFVQDKVPGVFTFDDRPWDTTAQEFEFWLGLTDNTDSILAEMAKKTQFTETENEFYRNYLTAEKNADAEAPAKESLELPPDLSADYSTFKVAELKERCRDRGLPVSGTKAVLLERVEADVEEEKKRLEEEHKANNQRKGTIRPVATARLNIQPSFQLELEKFDTENIDPAIKEHLINVIKEYLQASGGRAGSRDIGRYLAANKALDTDQYVSALQELKKHYGSFVNFIMANNDVFSRGKQHLTREGKEYGFPVWEKKEGDTLVGRSAWMEDIPPPRLPRGRPDQRRRYSGGLPRRSPGRGSGRGPGRFFGRGPGRGPGRGIGRGRF